jgi:hypothetical protein
MWGNAGTLSRCNAKQKKKKVRGKACRVFHSTWKANSLSRRSGGSVVKEEDSVHKPASALAHPHKLSASVTAYCQGETHTYTKREKRPPAPTAGCEDAHRSFPSFSLPACCLSTKQQAKMESKMCRKRCVGPLHRLPVSKAAVSTKSHTFYTLGLSSLRQRSAAAQTPARYTPHCSFVFPSS